MELIVYFCVESKSIQPKHATSISLLGFLYTFRGGELEQTVKLPSKRGNYQWERTALSSVWLLLGRRYHPNSSQHCAIPNFRSAWFPTRKWKLAMPSLLPGRKRRSNLYFWVNYYPSTKSQTQHSCQHRRFRTYQDTYSSRDWTVSRHLGLAKWWKTVSTNRKSDSKRISYLDPANSHYNQSALHSGLALSAIQNHSFYLTS